MAQGLGWSQPRYWRFENAMDALLSDLSTVAALLGLELSWGLHKVGDATVDRGHLALLARFHDLLAPTIRVVAEALLPNPGDPRAWDLLLRTGAQLVRVEAETRIRDVQATVRRIRGRERDGGVDEIVLVLADTRANRAVRTQLVGALGQRFTTPSGQLLGALRSGKPIPGSGVVLV